MLFYAVFDHDFITNCKICGNSSNILSNSRSKLHKHNERKHLDRITVPNYWPELEFLDRRISGNNDRRNGLNGEIYVYGYLSVSKVSQGAAEIALPIRRCYRRNFTIEFKSPAICKTFRVETMEQWNKMSGKFRDGSYNLSLYSLTNKRKYYALFLRKQIANTSLVFNLKIAFKFSRVCSCINLLDILLICCKNLRLLFFS